MRATWYVTEAGDAVDPAECSRKDGVLTHKSGAKIDMRFPDCPRSRGVDLDEHGKLPFAGKGDHDGNGKVGGAKPAPADGEANAGPAEPGSEPGPEPAKHTEDLKPEPAPVAVKKPGYKTRGKQTTESGGFGY